MEGTAVPPAPAPCARRGAATPTQHPSTPGTATALPRGRGPRLSCPPAVPLHLRGAPGCSGPLWVRVSASPALNFVAEAALAARGHPQGDGGKGCHGGSTAPAGGPVGPPGTRGSGAEGHCGVWLPQLAPRCDRVRAAAWGLFLALHHCYSSRCRLVASLTATRTQPCTHTRVPPTSPNPYTPRRPRAHHPGQPRGPQPPQTHIKAAGSDAQWPSHAVASRQPQLGAAAPRAVRVFTSPSPSSWRGATEGSAQCNAEICLGSCPRGGWHVLGLIPQLPVPLRVSILSGTPLGAARCRSSPMEPAGTPGGSLPPCGHRAGREGPGMRVLLPCRQEAAAMQRAGAAGATGTGSGHPRTDGCCARLEPGCTCPSRG